MVYFQKVPSFLHCLKSTISKKPPAVTLYTRLLISCYNCVSVYGIVSHTSDPSHMKLADGATADIEAETTERSKKVITEQKLTQWPNKRRYIRQLVAGPPELKKRKRKLQKSTQMHATTGRQNKIQLHRKDCKEQPDQTGFKCKIKVLTEARAQ